MAAQEDNHPLLASLPPATDPLTYLTILEYNLNEENLPLLHKILQDSALTAQIGWDLVELLIPLLPASEECLQDIAVRGNPREVILKVTEALRRLEFGDPRTESDEDEVDLISTAATAGTSATETDDLDHASTAATAGTSTTEPSLDQGPLPLAVQQFDVLLSLLSTLHGRIQTKYPSRFLSTSLQAVLAAYGKAHRHLDEITESAVKFAKTLSGTKRPHLPSRISSGNLLRAPSNFSEPDPEAQSESPSEEEGHMITKLLQSFVTHVLEDYMLSLSSGDDIPGLAWASRLTEKFHPERIVPSKPTYATRFSEAPDLKSHLSIVGQLVAIAQDLGISTQTLLDTIMDPTSEESGNAGEESEPPSSAAEIPLSKTGSLLLYTARKVSEKLFDAAWADESTDISIFPHHSTLIKNFVGTLGIQTIGMEPEVLLDALLALGLIALEENRIGEPIDDEQFEHHLRALSLISANTPSPTLRYQAHYLVSTLLRSHPSDLVRLSFIRSTLEDCPYENLKASAVGWLKGETLEANMNSHGSSSATPPQSATGEAPSIFATPVAIGTVLPYLFPDQTQKLAPSAELSETWVQFRMDLGFYLAALNFYYLLLVSKPLHEVLNVPSLLQGANIESTYLKPLSEAIVRFKDALSKGELEAPEDAEAIESHLGELRLLEHVLGSVKEGAKSLSA